MKRVIWADFSNSITSFFEILAQVTSQAEIYGLVIRKLILTKFNDLPVFWSFLTTYEPNTDITIQRQTLISKTTAIMYEVYASTLIILFIMSNILNFKFYTIHFSKKTQQTYNQMVTVLSSTPWLMEQSEFSLNMKFTEN